MRTLIWLATAALAAIWSLMCWGAHALISYGGGLAARNADIVPWLPPELIELASWLAIAGTHVGEWLVVAVWVVGMVILLALGGIGARLLGRRRAPSFEEKSSP
jgi:hypothetical protein